MSKIVLVKVKSEQGSLNKNKGTALAPEILLKKIAIPEHAKAEIPIAESNIEENDKSIFENARRQMIRKRFPVFIGGDHSISYSTVKAFSEKHKNPSLIVFDAHPDCVQFFKPLSHEDWVRGIVEEKIVDKKNILLIGTRKIHKLEKKYLEQKKIETIRAEEIKKSQKQSLEQLNKFLQKSQSVYLSIDIDVFDPKICPGTGYLEKGGLTENQFSLFFEKILESGKVKAVDLVEINPKKDKKGKTIKVGTNILKKILEHHEKISIAEQFSLYMALVLLINFLKELEKSIEKEFKLKDEKFAEQKKKKSRKKIKTAKR